MLMIGMNWRAHRPRAFVPAPPPHRVAHFHPAPSQPIRTTKSETESLHLREMNSKQKSIIFMQIIVEKKIQFKFK
jgi:hypothetical protein